MAKQEKNDYIWPLSIVGIVAVVAVFGMIGPISSTVTSTPAVYTSDSGNLAGDAVGTSCVLSCYDGFCNGEDGEDFQLGCSNYDSYSTCVLEGCINVEKIRTK